MSDLTSRERKRAKPEIKGLKVPFRHLLRTYFIKSRSSSLHKFIWDDRVRQQDGSSETVPSESTVEAEPLKPNQKPAAPVPPRGGKAGARGRPRGRGKRR